MPSGHGLLTEAVVGVRTAAHRGSRRLATYLEQGTGGVTPAGTPTLKDVR
jgi:hypothetical protein